MKQPVTQYTTIEVTQDEHGTWHATQGDIGLTGRGPNAARAVAHYAELVAETTYEIENGDNTSAAPVPSDD